MVLGLLYIACAPAPAPWVDPAANDDWSGDVATSDHVAQWDAAGVAAQFATATASGFPAPSVVFRDYAELMTHTEASCPADPMGGGFMELGGCNTTTGYTYRGAVGETLQDQRVTASDGSWTGSYYLMFSPADFVIIRPDGMELDVGGNANQQINADNHGTNWGGCISGTFRDEAEGGWLAGGFSGDVCVTGTTGGSATVDGSVSIAEAAVVYSSVTFDPSSCPDGATGGTISVRQPDSTWYVITLLSTCGACGDAIWDGKDDIGQVCLDFTTFFDTIPDLSAP